MWWIVIGFGSMSMYSPGGFWSRTAPRISSRSSRLRNARTRYSTIVQDLQRLTVVADRVARQDGGGVEQVVGDGRVGHRCKVTLPNRRPPDRPD